ncbi:hypothetical protein GCM10022226_33220 [Sphaerisporangium flaviroseum]|uniref:Uncharacterized protein n=1 Tax=Sphaerisporangium flaviroseum TaxID=509199 RepID=A0ABP7I562_9ACTN
MPAFIGKESEPAQHPDTYQPRRTPSQAFRPHSTGRTPLTPLPTRHTDSSTPLTSASAGGGVDFCRVYRANTDCFPATLELLVGTIGSLIAKPASITRIPPTLTPSARSFI